MCRQQVRAVRHLGPAGHGAARGGVFQGAAQHRATGGGAECCGPYQTEQHFRPAFPHENFAVRCVEQQPRVRLALLDGRTKRLARRVVAPGVIVGIACKIRRRLDDAFQRQCAARILEVDTRSTEGTGLHMGEPVADFLDQSGMGAQGHVRVLQGQKSRNLSPSVFLRPDRRAVRKGALQSGVFRGRRHSGCRPARRGRPSGSRSREISRRCSHIRPS